VRLPRVLHLVPWLSGPQPCRCGHAERAHEHYRSGTDCALCSCPKFKASAARGRGARGPRGERAHAA
jgi:hypothetical protein